LAAKLLAVDCQGSPITLGGRWALAYLLLFRIPAFADRCTVRLNVSSGALPKSHTRSKASLQLEHARLLG
jgi:hypothetical protein